MAWVLCVDEKIKFNGLILAPTKFDYFLWFLRSLQFNDSAFTFHICENIVETKRFSAIFQLYLT